MKNNNSNTLATAQNVHNRDTRNLLTDSIARLRDLHRCVTNDLAPSANRQEARVGFDYQLEEVQALLEALDTSAQAADLS